MLHAGGGGEDGEDGEDGDDDDGGGGGGGGGGGDACDGLCPKYSHGRRHAVRGHRPVALGFLRRPDGAPDGLPPLHGESRARHPSL